MKMMLSVMNYFYKAAKFIFDIIDNIIIKSYSMFGIYTVIVVLLAIYLLHIYVKKNFGRRINSLGSIILEPFIFTVINDLFDYVLRIIHKLVYTILDKPIRFVINIMIKNENVTKTIENRYKKLLNKEVIRKVNEHIENSKKNGGKINVKKEFLQKWYEAELKIKHENKRPYLPKDEVAKRKLVELVENQVSLGNVVLKSEIMKETKTIILAVAETGSGLVKISVHPIIKFGYASLSEKEIDEILEKVSKITRETEKESFVQDIRNASIEWLDLSIEYYTTLEKLNDDFTKIYAFVEYAERPFVSYIKSLTENAGEIKYAYPIGVIRELNKEIGNIELFKEYAEAMASGHMHKVKRMAFNIIDGKELYNEEMESFTDDLIIRNENINKKKKVYSTNKNVDSKNLDISGAGETFKLALVSFEH